MASHHRISSELDGLLIVEHILTLVNSGGMVRQVRQRDASPAATEGLAAVAVGTEQIRLSSSMFGGGTKCGQSGTAKHQAFGGESMGERGGRVESSRGFGLAVAPSAAPLSPDLPSTVA